VEEEGISEDDYFESHMLEGAVIARTLIKPGFVATVPLELKSYPVDEDEEDEGAPKRGVHVLVAKNPAFGTDAYLAGLAVPADDDSIKAEARKHRVKAAARCDISRQIVAITAEKNGGKFFTDLVTVQVISFFLSRQNLVFFCLRCRKFNRWVPVPVPIYRFRFWIRF
jgi:hypothetical protein